MDDTRTTLAVQRFLNELAGAEPIVRELLATAVERETMLWSSPTFSVTLRMAMSSASRPRGAGSSDSIAMGLGGYLASRSDTEHYASERLREEQEIIEKREAERQEVLDVFRAYGVTSEQAKSVVDSLESNPQAWVDFMMRFELGLEKPEPTRARNSALTIALSYIIGGLVPLSPYMLLHSARHALWLSVGVTLLALLIFGYVKGRFTGKTPVRSALQTAVVGGLAAAAAFGIAKAIA